MAADLETRVAELEKQVAEIKQLLIGEPDSYFSFKYTAEEMEALFDKVKALP